MTTSPEVGAVLTCALVVGVAVNVTALVVWCRVPFVRRPHLVLYGHLILVDLLGLVLRTVPSTVIAFGGAAPSQGICSLQGFVKDFCHLVNMHILLVLAMERVVSIYKPSRHRASFDSGAPVFMLIIAIWVFNCVNALLPVIGWGRYFFFQSQFECTTDTVSSPSLMNFMFVLIYVVPIAGIVVCYSLFAHRVRVARKRVTATGAILLEEQQYPIGDTYTDRLLRQQQKFNLAGTKRNKPILKEKQTTYTAEGYESDSSSSSSDDDSVREKRPRQQRHYYLAKSDLQLAKTYAFISFMYIALWLPYAITTYVYTYNVYGNTSTTALAAVVCLTHLPAFVKIALSMCNPKFRKAFLKGVCCCKSRKAVKKARH